MNRINILVVLLTLVLHVEAWAKATERASCSLR